MFSVIVDIKNLKKEVGNLFTIIIPRHPYRETGIKDLLKKNNCPFISNIEEFKKNSELMLVSQIGVLGDYFRLTEIIFMGGSFVRVGGHNIIEPAKLLCAILMGPYYCNFEEITKDFIKKEAILIVENQEQLYKQVLLLFKDIKVRNKLIKNAMYAAQKYDNLIDDVIENVEKFI